jgi:8-oxo-dGTP pyrophosphatase MutT (NUDIX family)
MKEATLCYLVRDRTIWLAMKKRGFGSGKYNGYGGKLNEGETIEEAMIRELYEESGVKAVEYHKVADNTHVFPNNPKNNFHVHVYFVTKWTGIPRETEEMSPELFENSKIPYQKMWHTDPYWLPSVLKGEKLKTYFEMTETEVLDKKISKISQNDHP